MLGVLGSIFGIGAMFAVAKFFTHGPSQFDEGVWTPNSAERAKRLKLARRAYWGPLYWG
jgi:hypothetical protein